MDTENPGDITGLGEKIWLTDSKFKVRGAMAIREDGGKELRVRDDYNSPWKVLVVWKEEDNFTTAIGFTPDDKGIYLIDSSDSNTMRAVQIDIESGKKLVLAEDQDYDVNNYIIEPKTHKLQAVSFLKDREYWKIIDESIEDDFENIKKIHKGDFFLINKDKR
ncbi:MAG: hypothetical protein ACPLW7_03010 [Minisyncoccia bacterium]